MAWVPIRYPGSGHAGFSALARLNFWKSASSHPMRDGINPVCLMHRFARIAGKPAPTEKQVGD
jgi:hypothetical protein